MTKKKKKRFSLSKTWTNILLGIVTVFTAISAVIFLLPTVLTITNSFMAQSEINANYGMIFNTVTGNKTFIAEKVNLKFIPDMVSFGQYGTFLLNIPDTCGAGGILFLCTAHGKDKGDHILHLYRGNAHALPGNTGA